MTDRHSRIGSLSLAGVRKHKLQYIGYSACGCYLYDTRVMKVLQCELASDSTMSKLHSTRSTPGVAVLLRMRVDEFCNVHFRHCSCTAVFFTCEHPGISDSIPASTHWVCAAKQEQHELSTTFERWASSGVYLSHFSCCSWQQGMRSIAVSRRHVFEKPPTILCFCGYAKAQTVPLRVVLYLLDARHDSLAV